MTEARVVIVGGGIVGAAAAYHLTQVHGWRDIVLIDQGPLPYNVGSTSHAPGGVVAAAHSRTLTLMGKYSADLYRSLSSIDEKHHAVNHFGGIELARSPARLEDMKRLHGKIKGLGLGSHMMSPDEVVEHLPWVDPGVLAGALFVDDSMLAKGYHAVGSLLELAAGDDAAVTVFDETALVDIETVDGRVSAVTTSRPDIGRIECEQVLLAANVWSPAIAAQVGVNVPLMAFEHQYAITQGLLDWSEFAGSDPDLEVRYPLVRDLDTAMYYRAHWDALGIGSYQHAPRAVRPENMGPTALREFTPEAFGDAWHQARELVPMLSNADPDFASAYNGIFAFSVDGMPIIGPSSVVDGLWSANASWLTHAGGVAKSVAEWMATGDTEWDMRECHLHRFQPFMETRAYIDSITSLNYVEVYDIRHPSQPPTEPRDVRRTPFHEAHVAAGAEFVPFAGMELPNWFESNASLVDSFGEAIPQREGWGARYWSRIQGAEHLQARRTAGLWDLSGLSIIEVAGRDALANVELLCSNRMDVPIDRVVYTCWLSPRGGIRRDLAVARLAPDRFWMFVGEGTLPMDLDWVQRHASGRVTVIDRSPAFSALGVFGPNAVDIMSAAAGRDLAETGPDYYSGQTIEIAMTPVYGMRLSYVGEAGFELHIPTESSMRVWDAIVAAGAEKGMIRAGLGAMDSMRLEKGYRLWGADIHTEYDPYQAGMGWTVKSDKGHFIGRDAALIAKENYRSGTEAKRLVCLAVDDPAAVLRGYEPVLRDGTVVGYTTSGNFGYSVGRYLAFAYVEATLAEPGTALTVEWFDEPYSAEVIADPAFDPSGSRMQP